MQVTFIGGGNMASAIIGGYVTTGASPQAIHVVDPNDQVLDRLSRDWGITPHHALDEHALAVDVVVLAVKPQVMPEVLATLATRMPAAHAAHGPVVVSVAGGITLDTMANALGERAMIRCMPNTPALVGAGITALVANAHTTAEHRRLASHLLEQVGTCVWLDDEPLLDLVTAVSGSGPATFLRWPSTWSPRPWPGAWTTSWRGHWSIKPPQVQARCSPKRASMRPPSARTSPRQAAPQKRHSAHLMPPNWTPPSIRQLTRRGGAHKLWPRTWGKRPNPRLATDNRRHNPWVL